MNEPTTDTDPGLEALAAESRRRFAERSAAVPGAVQSRLTAARHAALAARPAAGTRHFRVPGLWLPLGALAAAAVLALAVLLARPPAPATVVAEANPVEDAELLASNDGPELYSEEPEFYEWAGDDSAGSG